MQENSDDHPDHRHDIDHDGDDGDGVSHPVSLPTPSSLVFDHAKSAAVP